MARAPRKRTPSTRTDASKASSGSGSGRRGSLKGTSYAPKRPDFGVDEGMKARQRGTDVAGMTPPSPRAPARPAAPVKPAPKATASAKAPAPKTASSTKPSGRMTDAELDAWNAKRGNAKTGSYQKTNKYR